MKRTPPAFVVVVCLGALLAGAGACSKQDVASDAGPLVVVDAGPVAPPPDPAEAARVAARLQDALAGSACPPGTRKVGAEPPDGFEAWCERPAPPGEKPVRHGPYEAWHDNGVKSVSGAYVEGERDGAWTLWHRNGQRHQEWRYTKGVPDGPFREWDEAGTPVASVVYKMGKVVSQRR
jgi:hypothetical protein